MPEVDTYPNVAVAADGDEVWGIDASATAGSRSSLFSLAVLRAFLGEIRIPVAATAHGFSVGDLVQRGSGSWAAADASDVASALYTGMVVSVPDVDNFVVQMAGLVSGLSGLTDGTWYYLQDDGSLGTSAGTVRCPVLVASGTTAGFLVPAAPLDPRAVTLSNLAATAAPAVGDDSADGYTVGSAWFDTTNDDAYVCLDASAGAAVWKKTTP